MTIYFSNKTILITGATKGLGAELSKKFWQQGANLILIARTKILLEKMRDELLLTKSSNQHIEIFAVDLSSTEQTEKMIEIILSKKIDILINNAAIHGPIGPVWENDWEKWNAALQVNLLSPIALCRAVVPCMIQQKKGKIINVSGGGAASVRPKFSAYAVAKSGIVRFSEILAEEVKSFNIDVNCIAPGMMNTTLLHDILNAGCENAGEIEFQQAKKHIEKNENHFECATELCLLIASEKCDGITGKLISAMWDPWEKLPDYIHELKNSDIYTLRRIIPRDRGKNWGDA